MAVTKIPCIKCRSIWIVDDSKELTANEIGLVRDKVCSVCRLAGNWTEEKDYLQQSANQNPLYGDPYNR